MTKFTFNLTYLDYPNMKTSLQRHMNIFLYGTDLKEDYEKSESRITKTNRESLTRISGFVVVLLFVMFILSYFVPLFETSRSAFLICFFISVIIYALVLWPAKKWPQFTYIAMYGFMAMILCIGIALGTFIEPRQASISFAVLMFGVPLLFTDVPYRVNIMTIVGIGLYLLCAYITQDSKMFAFNLSAVIPYGVISIVITTYIQRVKINSFVLQDKTELMDEVIALNSELEAHQLQLEESSAEQEAQLEEITALNAQLQDKQIHLEESTAEQEAQLEEITALNEQLQKEQLILSAMTQDQQKKISEIESLNDRLQRHNNIIAKAGIGIWRIILEDGKAPVMRANNKMRDLLGIAGQEIEPEEIYKLWYNNIDVNSLDSVKRSVQNMINGQVDENTYTWNHPTLGARTVRSGGLADPASNGTILMGYHYDVTDQKVYEERSNLVISSLAYSYDYLSYVSMDDYSFVNIDNKLPFEEEFHNALNGTDARNVAKYVCDHRVAPEFIEEMRVFTDFTTLNERMKDSRALVNQYKTANGIWFLWSFIVSDRNPDGTLKHLICAIRKIDDEKQAELKKQKIIDDNIAANKAKTLFLHNMSHEIRTPLNAMFGFAQLLGLPDGSWTDEEKEEYNNYIFNSYNMLDMLIGDILDIADSEHGNYRINIGDVPVNLMCRNAMMSVEYRKSAAVNMYYTSDVEDSHIIQSDGRRIQQVLINYLTNACKHTMEGEIHLHCSTTEHPGKLTFSVTDTGKGIPADKADLIFNRFTKLDQFTQGSGLGLNICQTIADKLGGEVYLDKSYKTGARFVFVIDNK